MIHFKHQVVSVPTSGEFVPRLGISTYFDEKSGHLRNPGI